MSKGLELVRRLTVLKERQARRAFADTVADLRGAEANLASLNNRRETLRRRLAAMVSEGIDGDRVAETYRYLDELGQRVDRAAGACATCRETSAGAESAWLVTRQNLKGMESICQRRAEREQRDRERREQRLMDDLYRPRMLGLADKNEDAHVA